MIDHLKSRRRVDVPPSVMAYLADVADTCSGSEGPLVSLVAFGSAITGGYEASTSDVDLLVVVTDDVDDAKRGRVIDVIAALEAQRGLAKRRSNRQGSLAEALKRFADRTTDHERSFFVCTRADLLSGEPQRILNLSWPQAVFVDRVVVHSIVSSAITVWGEELLNHVPLQLIRRVDVAKSFFALFGQAVFAAAVYLLFVDVTRYAMDALKRSIHNCYFCHNGRSESLALEMAYFERRYGSRAAFAQLLALRRQYRPSFGFVVRCLSAIAALHLRTLIHLRFPRRVDMPVDHNRASQRKR